MPLIAQGEKPDDTPWFLRNLPNLQMLNLQGVFEDHTLHYCVRGQAALLIQGLVLNNERQQYCNAGLFFYGASDSVIADLFAMQQGFEDEYSEWLVSPDLAVQNNLRNLTTLAFVLARGEGVTELSPVVLLEALPNLCRLVQKESKYRKGILKNIPDYQQYFVLNECTIKS